MSALMDAFTVLMVLAGAFFFMAGTVGLLRFPDALSRLHALTKVDTLGLGLIALGLLPQAGGPLAALKILLALGLVLFAGAVAGQLIAAVARRERRDDNGAGKRSAPSS
ncbi:monovalent cation/H(+) antiporter subunit G [Ancylobacter pratisalsi]|uniref:Na+/H+ antiporter subunit G n=1 Tax=Ancylobacter pratisalsi TaxID=1745854 RepID=A0A6P1YK21_9HYPH|nr:monovalent cation/H(+) antiporter subunit G [Ancylobacter pratisalsi]QIB33649.1 Na+/H+ antiporter subunit G [Ancylobacter pratisalsi]